MPKIHVEGETLRATIPVHDSWGEGAPDLRGKSLTLVLADNGVAQKAVLLLVTRLQLKARRSRCGRWC